ncbi:hypothetical protein STEG23_028634 [Scotinomys teguina]
MTEQQMEQGQENQVHQPQDQVVTATNDLGVLPVNFFGCDSSEYPEHEIQSLPLLTTEERLGHAEERMELVEERMGHAGERTGHAGERLGLAKERMDHAKEKMGHAKRRMGHA